MKIITLIGVQPTELQTDNFPDNEKNQFLEELKRAFQSDSDVRVDSYENKEKTRLLAKHKASVINDNMNSLSDFNFDLVDI